MTQWQCWKQRQELRLAHHRTRAHPLILWGWQGQWELPIRHAHPMRQVLQAGLAEEVPRQARVTQQLQALGLSQEQQWQQGWGVAQQRARWHGDCHHQASHDQGSEG